MQVEIVSIGGELLSGMTVNTNAAFLSREAGKLGFKVIRHTVVPDDVVSIQESIKAALNRASLVITTGGLGPTVDDLTNGAVKHLFKKGESLKNTIGSAPGTFFFHEGKALVLLPGVPREMTRMFLEEALSKIQAHFPREKIYLHTASLCLLRELEVDPLLREWQEKHPELEVGIYPAYGTLQVSLRSKKPVDSYVRELQNKFPSFFYGEGKIEEAVHRELIARKMRLGIAESITGGGIAARLTALPDASLFLDGSIVAYSNAWKERFLIVSHSTLEKQGAVSRKTVEEMAEGILSETDVDYAIAVSGVAGPKGGSKEKPVGTIYIAIGKRGEKTDAGKIKGPDDRASCIELTIQTALGALWRRLVHNTFTFS